MSTPDAKRQVSCPNCAKRMLAPLSYAGKKLKCPQCAKTFTCDFGVSTMESGQDRIRAAAAAAPPPGGFKVIQTHDEKVDPKAEITRFFLGALAAIVTGVVGVVIWHFVYKATGTFIPAFSFLLAPLTGLAMLAVYRKPGDASAGALAAFLYVAVVCLTFWVLWGGGPSFASKPHDADDRDALAALMTADQTAALDATRADGQTKIRDLRAAARKTLEPLADAEVLGKMEPYFDKDRRAQAVEFVARDQAFKDGWSNVNIHELQKDPKLWAEAGKKSLAMPVAEVRELVASEMADRNAKMYFEREMERLCAKEGIDPNLKMARRNEIYDQLKVTMRSMSPAQIDSGMRVLLARSAASESAATHAAASRMPIEPDRWVAVMLVTSALLAGVAAFGWKAGD